MLGMTAFMQNIDPNTLKEMQNQGNGDAPQRQDDPAALISDFMNWCDLSKFTYIYILHKIVTHSATLMSAWSRFR